MQPQPENTAESQAPTEEPSRGAQASSKRKEERPSSQENPEVGGGGVRAAVGRAPQGLGRRLAPGAEVPLLRAPDLLAEGPCGAVLSSDPGPVCLAWPPSPGGAPQASQS